MTEPSSRGEPDPEEPEREGYLSPEVELVGVQAVGRVCTLCADPVPGAG